ncbi:hypothetical protein VE01_04776 [Pseudogymnoascus verrucosus]|uniref:EF-hand domain-containing protein n=1 Tax=Pseudogymnoascus verrucosus TaxID=342668 RepID=A0A1B8GMJ4_9PEZI|nr:uncharacterized protein VE01_04776 [Pseudogymnoascus verrucosus]OBT97061.1 hypothetical protein VE01_04776 [Pseudogymnoascus verrucosus]
MSLPFHCTSCTFPIPPTSPRISCNTCPSHFCASCYILSRSPGPHLASHPSLLYEYSGYPPRTPPELPPRPPLQPINTAASTQRRPVSTQLPLASLKQVGGEGLPPQRYPPQPSVSASTTPPPFASPHAASPQTSHAPPAPEIPSSASSQTNYAAPSESTNTVLPEAGPSRSSPYAYTSRSNSTPGPQTPQYTYEPSQGPVPSQPQQQQKYQQPPQQPPRPQLQQTHSAASTGWQPFYNNTAPTAFGMAFFNEIFNHLDTNRTGLLLPEQYSGFLDIIGYSLEQNAWKNQMSKPVFGYNPQDFADYQLRQEYINFSIDHVMAPRPPSAPNTDIRSSFSSLRNIVPPSFSKILDSIPTGNSISGNQMPLLTRRGFIDHCANEFLYYPNDGFNCVTKAARHYGIWRELGEMPRNVFPVVAPQELLDRVKIINIEAARKAEDLLAAKTIEANIAAKGRRNALNLIGGDRWEYI